MSEDFIYERRRLPEGIKLELVTGGTRYKGKVWTEIARQIYCENGKDNYREIGHFKSGAPFLYGEDVRISISHTEGCLAVATIKADHEVNLMDFSPLTALGIDVEKADREKVVELRERFLSARELEMMDTSSIEPNLIAWTCKEAMLKAGMDRAINWHNDIIIDLLPTLSTKGKGHIVLNGERFNMELISLLSDGYIITLAYS